MCLSASALETASTCCKTYKTWTWPLWRQRLKLRVVTRINKSIKKVSVVELSRSKWSPVADSSEPYYDLNEWAFMNNSCKERKTVFVQVWKVSLRGSDWLSESVSSVFGTSASLCVRNQTMSALNYVPVSWIKTVISFLHSSPASLCM